jgi:hypothetical protein
MTKRASMGIAIWLGLGGVALAGPGDLMDTVHSSDEGGAVTVLEAAKAAPCALKAALCATPGARSTLAVASAPVASATPAPGEQPGHAPLAPSAPVVPRFARAGAAGEAAAGDATGAWTIDLSANLKRSAWNGNALFIFFDAEDPEALENKQFTALYQAPIKAGPKLAARVALSPEEGFRAGHTYRVRIVQLVNGKEYLLAEGDLALM